MMESTIQWVL